MEVGHSSVLLSVGRMCTCSSLSELYSVGIHWDGMRKMRKTAGKVTDINFFSRKKA